MNPLLTTKAESFRSGSDNLEFYHNRLVKLTNGVLMFCSGGEAEITIDLEKHHIIPNTNIMLLPGSIAEAEIYEKFNEITGDKTAIYISHRLSSCKFCDKIVVFHEGSVIQTGTHQELAADRSGKYFQLWTAQAQYYR